MLKITDQELDTISKYVYDLTGIVLDRSKAYLLESRLGILLRELECNSYQELYFRARNDYTHRIRNKIIDAITTKETSFFRDNSPFEMLKYKLIPDMIDRINGSIAPSLNVWSAACSTGQEVYSTIITFMEMIPDLPRWRLRVLGTDISDAAIAQASYGAYNRVEISRGLSQNQLNKYFNPVENTWRIKDEILSYAHFRKLNLLEPMNSVGKFDLIFCRNVAIYFNVEDRKTMFNQLANHLNPHGALLIGASESLIGISNRFVRREYLRSVFYQLVS